MCDLQVIICMHVHMYESVYIGPHPQYTCASNTTIISGNLCGKSKYDQVCVHPICKGVRIGLERSEKHNLETQLSVE
jgi:hypothetical protein